MKVRKKWLFAFFMLFSILLIFWSECFANIDDPDLFAVSQIFLQEKNQAGSSLSSELMKFIERMPKGADLHNHFIGAVYPENLMSYLRNDSGYSSWCVYPDAGYEIRQDTSCLLHGGTLANSISYTSDVYASILKAWSMLDFQSVPPRFGHDHFFSIFIKKYELTGDTRYWPVMLANLMRQANKEHMLYLEFIIKPDNGSDSDSVNYFAKNYLHNFSASTDSKNIKHAMDVLARHDFYNRVVRHNIAEPIARTVADARHILRCGTSMAEHACDITVKFQYGVNRTEPINVVFTGMYAGLLAAAKEHHDDFVGVNLVAAEDNDQALEDYNLQMRLIGAVRKIMNRQYGYIPVSLHAGELTTNFVSQHKGGENNMKFHVYNAIKLAHTDRVGHGSDVLSEVKSHPSLLHLLSGKNCLVEISLTSNKDILGVCDNSFSCISPQYRVHFNHPFYDYLKSGVPVALSTDDQGILITDLSNEYYIASTVYPISYNDLKNIDRNSLSYGFLPGKELWEKPYHGYPEWNYTKFVKPCEKDNPYKKERPSQSCQNFLQKNLKARLQWKLETQFASFERDVRGN